MKRILSICYVLIFLVFLCPAQNNVVRKSFGVEVEFEINRYGTYKDYNNRGKMTEYTCAEIIVRDVSEDIVLLIPLNGKIRSEIPIWELVYDLGMGEEYCEIPLLKVVRKGEPFYIEIRMPNTESIENFIDNVIFNKCPLGNAINKHSYNSRKIVITI